MSPTSLSYGLVLWVYNHLSSFPLIASFKGEFYQSGCNSGIRVVHSLGMTFVSEL